MEHLFDRNTALNQDVFRNILFFEKPECLFDDLMSAKDLKKGTKIALDAEARVKKNPGIIFQNFHYSTAIDYPFAKKPYQGTRYSNGEYCVWYGSIEHLTTIYETVYHMFRSTLALEGIKEIIIRKRAIYAVRSKAILIDLREKQHPELISNNYTFTQNIGAMIQKEGHPGLIAPSARTKGNNVVIFNPKVLSDPRPLENLEYVLDPIQHITTVKNGEGNILMNIQLTDFG